MPAGRGTAAAVLGLLAGSATCIALAPALMPAGYSALSLSVSESAGQGVPGAWLARAGFLLLGFAVLLEAQVAGVAWGRWGRLAHRTYAVAMIAVAAFSHMPWDGTPYDPVEDTLHSVAATLVGFAFTTGVVVVGLRRGRRAGWIRAVDALAVVAAVVLPLVQANVESIGGLAQRVLFGVGYLWYGAEAARLVSPAPSPAPARPGPARAARRGRSR